MKKVVVYTAPACGYCVRAKQLLNSRGIAFEEVFISWDDEAAWIEMEKKSGMKTVPQIYIGGQLIGGYTDLYSLDQSGKLLDLINSKE